MQCQCVFISFRRYLLNRAKQSKQILARCILSGLRYSQKDPTWDRVWNSSSLDTSFGKDLLLASLPRRLSTDCKVTENKKIKIRLSDVLSRRPSRRSLDYKLFQREQMGDL